MLTLFDYAHSIHQQETVGTVVVVARPRIDKQKTGGGKVTLSIEAVDQLTIIGAGKTLWLCIFEDNVRHQAQAADFLLQARRSILGIAWQIARTALRAQSL